MTGPVSQPPQLKSVRSNRRVVSGWKDMVSGTADTIEIQIDLNAKDQGREQATLLIEYWATSDELTLQSILPVRAFSATPEGWCVMLPAQGRMIVRAIDPQPSPPILVTQIINVSPETAPGTMLNVAVSFPDPENPAAPLLQPMPNRN